MSRIKDESDIDEFVDIIASGYEWICPICDELIREIEYTEEVSHCKQVFKTNLPVHAYD